jgi:phosphohistidine swiveling domain-containing protein
LGWRPRRGVERGPAAGLSAHGLPGARGASHKALDGGVNAEAAWADGVEEFAGQLDRLPDSTLRARAADVRDVGRRVLDRLAGGGGAGLVLRAPSVVVARDPGPSQLAVLDLRQVLAVCLAEEGPTSHAGILAKAWGKPAVVGLGPAILKLPEGTPLLVDGSRGEVVANPEPALRRAFAKRAEAADRRRQAELSAALAPAVTRDGHRVEVLANVGTVDEAFAARRVGAQRIGFLRTEFLYLSQARARYSRRLGEVVDYVLDTRAPYGDAEYPPRVGTFSVPLSSACSCGTCCWHAWKRLPQRQACPCRGGRVPTSRAGRRATQRSWIATGRASPTCETGDGVASGALTPNTAGRWGLLESFAVLGQLVSTQHGQDRWPMPCRETSSCGRRGA